MLHFIKKVVKRYCELTSHNYLSTPTGTLPIIKK